MKRTKNKQKPLIILTAGGTAAMFIRRKRWPKNWKQGDTGWL